MLRTVSPRDLTIFFAQQLDPDANQMAAFTAKDPTDRDAFDAHWAKILADPAIIIRTIVVDARVAGDERVAGYVLVHGWFGKPEITYWLGKAYWGQGIATQALTRFLEVIPERPLYAHVAKDNVASRRVLEKCGFVISGKDKGFSNARKQEVEELILVLEE